MSAITIDDDLVHYEVLGRGRPVILVHGWLSSWRYWVPTMQQLSMKYRTYALDLWGFGDSGKDAPQRFTLEAHVKLLGDFMDKLGIAKTALVGHSLGAAVAIRYTLQQPDRVPRLMTVSAPIFEQALAANETNPTDPPGDGTQGTWHLPSAGTPLSAPTRPHALGQPIPQPDDLTSPPRTGVTTREVNLPPSPLRERFLGHRPQQMLEKHLGKDAPDFEKMAAEVSKAETNVHAVSAFSFDQVDLVHDLRRLSCPTLLVHGEGDTLLSPPSQRLVDFLSYGKGDFSCVVWPETRHFPMLDDPTTFHRLVMDFLDTPKLSDLTFKERWVRKVR